MLGRLVPIVQATKPAEWFIAFRRTTKSRLARALAFGRYKHVTCFGQVRGLNCWVFFDPGLDRLQLTIVPDEAADAVIARAMDGAKVIRFTPPVYPPKHTWRPVMVCTSIVARLADVRSCALRPDRLLADCLATGAEIVRDDEWATS